MLVVHERDTNSLRIGRSNEKRQRAVLRTCAPFWTLSRPISSGSSTSLRDYCITPRYRLPDLKFGG